VWRLGHAPVAAVARAVPEAASGADGQGDDAAGNGAPHRRITGSAMKNLHRRVERHRRKDKKIHWHIDYLLAQPSVQLIDVILHPSVLKEECKFNQILISNGAEVPVFGFGSSDCKICPAHLVKMIILPYFECSHCYYRKHYSYYIESQNNFRFVTSSFLKMMM